MADDALAESLAELSRFFVGDLTVMETLNRVADLTVRAIPAADLAGLTVLVEAANAPLSSPTRSHPRSTRPSTTPARDRAWTPSSSSGSSASSPPARTVPGRRFVEPPPNTACAARCRFP